MFHDPGAADGRIFGLAAPAARWQAKARIAARIARMALGNPGDAKSVGRRVMEMRIDYGPGYRVYYTDHGQTS